MFNALRIQGTDLEGSLLALKPMPTDIAFRQPNPPQLLFMLI